MSHLQPGRRGSSDIAMSTRYLAASAILAACSLLSVAAYLGATTASADAIPPDLALVLGLAVSCLLALWYLLSE